MIPHFTQEQTISLCNQAAERANLIISQGRFAEADVLLTQAIKVSPNHEQCLWLLAKSKHLSGKWQDAIDVFNIYNNYYGENPEYHNNMGVCLDQLGKLADAEVHFLKACDLNPSNANFYNNLGMVYRKQYLFQKAEIAFLRSITLNPAEKTYYFNLGSAYGEVKKMSECERYLRMALQLDPEYADAHLNLAYCLHLQGKWEEGFSHYEYRFQSVPRMNFWKNLYGENKLWDGAADLSGKRIVLWCEQGLGDNLMFARYIPFLTKKYQCKVILQSHPDIAPVFVKNMLKFTLDNVILSPNTEKDYDFHCSIASLPNLLKLGLLEQYPCLDGNPTVPDNYEHYEFKIGVVWAGSPEHPGDRNRSVHINRFAKLAKIPGVRMYCLQKDHRPRAYHDHPEPVDLSSGLSSSGIIYFGTQQFPDSAGMVNWIKGMDLIITVDTAILHLAGMTNTETWALIPYQADWRWQNSGNKTKWYKNVRLYRQTIRDNWDDVFDEIGKELILMNKSML